MIFLANEKSLLRRYDANGNGYLTLEEARELCFCFAAFLKDLPFRSESPILDEPDFMPDVQAEVESEDESDEELSLPSVGPEVQLGGDTDEEESEEEDLPPGRWFDRGPRVLGQNRSNPANPFIGPQIGRV